MTMSRSSSENHLRTNLLPWHYRTNSDTNHHRGQLLDLSTQCTTLEFCLDHVRFISHSIYGPFFTPLGKYLTHHPFHFSPKYLYIHSLAVIHRPSAISHYPDFHLQTPYFTNSTSLTFLSSKQSTLGKYQKLPFASFPCDNRYYLLSHPRISNGKSPSLHRLYTIWVSFFQEKLCIPSANT